MLTRLLCPSVLAALTIQLVRAGDSPATELGQVPKAMHVRMKDLPVVKVGQTSGDMMGRDQRVLQAAVDYVASLGGGVVEIGPGEFLMKDSLHLRSFVTVQGTPGQTILRKADGVVSKLAVDGDFGEEQITVDDPTGFAVGSGVAIWDSNAGGFHTTVARITGQKGNIFSIDHPLNSDCMVASGAKAATVFPVVSGCDVEKARVEHLIIEGNKEKNIDLNGCRGAGIYFYRGFGANISHCTVRSFHGDGISFQQSNDVVVEDCVSEGNTSLGLHPGSGSQRPTIKNCIARKNSDDGLFLCWRVRFGVFENNILEENGRYGISIGHKDTDNLLRSNQVRNNLQDGVCFRNETHGMAGHRNRLENNVIENNGTKTGGAGIRVRGETADVVLSGNIIRDTRSDPRQKVGIQLDEKVGNIAIEKNTITAETELRDLRGKKTL